MSTTTQAQIDQMALSAAKADWKKTALIVASVLHSFEDKQISITAEEIFDRIISLCEEGDLEFQGVLSNWRGSEVRLRSYCP